MNGNKCCIAEVVSGKVIMRKTVNYSINLIRCLFCFFLLSFFSFHSNVYAAAASYFDTVQKIYIGYYQRPADPGGLIYWAGRLDATGGNLTEIIEEFANSPESQALYGTINSTSIGNVLEEIYQSLLGRPADADGKDYYVAGFNAGRFTAATIMKNLIDGIGPTGVDRTTFDNKLAAANLFTTTIDPGLDGINFQATYSGDGDRIAGRNFLAWDATSMKVPTQAETTAYIRTNIANLDDAIGTDTAVTSASRFIDNGNGTILDTVSKLIWLKDANCFGVQEWANAMEKSDSLANGQCGLSDGSKARDWHLPYVQELQMVVDAGYRFTDLNSAGFSNVQADFYWSSNTSDCALNAYDVNMIDGLMYNDAKISSLYVWPVRAAR